MSEVIQGRELLNFIEQLGDLDWFKYETRYVNILLKNGGKIVEDRSGRPPYASFRFKVEKPEIIEKLKKTIADYQGEVEWIMDCYQRVSFPNSRNWTICPKKVIDSWQLALSSDISIGQWMEKYDPLFGPKAYKDVRVLVAYLSGVFGVQSIVPSTIRAGDDLV